MHLETESVRRNTCHALMVLYVKTRKKMETTPQTGNDLKPCHSQKSQCEVLDLSTKRVRSATPNSSSSFLPCPCPSPPPSKMRRFSPSATCSAPDTSEVESYCSTLYTAPTTLTGSPYRTPKALTGMEAGTMHSVESISPSARASSDDPREQTDDVRRFARRVEHSSPLFSFAHLHGISPITQPRAPQFDMPPAIGTFPFNAAAAAAAAAVSPFIRAFPGSGQPLLTDVASSLPLQVSIHPQVDFASAAAAAAATAFPSYLHQQRRRRRAQRCSDPATAAGSPHLSQHPSGLQHTTGSRGTDDDCSRESANVRTASRDSERSLSEEKDPAYLERRRKNNEAAKRSRDARRQKEEEIAARAATLEQENISLKAELLLLRRESAELHSLLYGGRVDHQR